MVVMAFDKGRLDIGLNAIVSMQRASGLPGGRVLVYSLHPEADKHLEELGVAWWPLHETLAKHVPGLENEAERESNGDGFHHKVLFKMAGCLLVLDLGYEALWLDADVTVMRDPTLALQGSRDDVSVTYCDGAETVEYWMEEYGSSTLVFPCSSTGVFHVRPTALAYRLLEEVVVRQEAHYYGKRRVEQGSYTRSYFDDQVAFNEVLGERFELGLGRLRLGMLDPWIWASTWTYDVAVSNRTGRVLQEPLLLHVFSLNQINKIMFMVLRGLWHLPVPKVQLVTAS